MSSSSDVHTATATTDDVPSTPGSDTTTDNAPTVKGKKGRMTLRKRFPEVKLHRRTPYQFYISEKAKENRDNKGEPKNASQYSQQWKLETDRSRWIEMAASDEIRFIEEVRSHGYNYDPRKNDRKRKKPCAPFLLYARDKFRKLQTDENITYREALKILGSKWKENAEPDVKSKYIEIAKVEKEKFEAEKKADEQAAAAAAETVQMQTEDSDAP